ncbi:MAG: DEAD/DEAH box helicase [Treponema sp.]|nr:DEAD/DEAH box helicase [Treponema sp.]
MSSDNTGKQGAFSNLSQTILKKLEENGITQPTKVQNEVIPQIAEGKSLIFQSETGTGKTYAYLLPLIDKLEKDSDTTTLRILVCAPTFELASQINTAAKKITERKTALFIGGAPLKRQLETLKEKPQIVIGTAARLVELIRLKKLKVNDIYALIFDECDRLLKKESYEDTDNLRNCVAKNCQIIGCSATLNKASRIFFADAEQKIMPEEFILSKSITHWAIYAENREKIDFLRKFLAAENPGKALIFTSRSDQVENIYKKLTYKHVDCMALFAKADKQMRKAAIDKFRSGKCRILITSDLGARGLDIPDITHIIQMDLPEEDDFFIHRSGRTARAGKRGINVVIGDEVEMRHYAALEKKFGLTVYPKQIRNGKISEPIV